MTAREAAAKIDISAVRTHHTIKDVEECVAYAKEYGFINVHSLPSYTKQVAQMLKDVKDVYVGAPVGFPSGGHRPEVKIREAELLMDDGVEEMDIVMNVGRFKEGDYNYVLEELKHVIAHTRERVLTKVIIELNCLADDEITKACDIVRDSGADFLKTGTGWVPGDANIARIKKIKEYLKDDLMVKAAGGIRTRGEFDALIDLGVERFGINTKSAIEIVRSFE